MHGSGSSSSRARWLIGGAIAIVAVVSLLVVRVLDRDRDTAERELAEAKLNALAVAAHGLRADLASIGDDLAVASRSLESLQSLAAVKRGYVMVASGDDEALAMGAPREVVELAMPVVARMLAASGPELTISPGLSSRDDAAAWYRVFARRVGDTPVAAVIDMRALVAPPDVLRNGASLLVLSAHGVAAPASDPALVASLDTERGATLRALVDEARTRGRSWAPLGGGALGAALSVPIDRGPPWVLALVASTDALQARRDALIVRLAVSAGLGLLVVALATVLVARNAALRDRLRAADQLQRAEKLATAGQLSAGIAHELGTPLSVARGRAEMVQLALGADHEEAANLRVVTDQIDHVTKLIRQLLDYVRPQPESVERVDLAVAIGTVVDLLASRAKRGLRAEGSGAVRAEPGQLQQLLVNLVLNAMDAGGDVAIRARGTTIEVSDTGAGIAPADRAHVFDPFFTTKKRGQGTGLGLWVVAQIARAHDAELELESELGKGTTVRVTFPEAA